MNDDYFKVGTAGLIILAIFAACMSVMMFRIGAPLQGVCLAAATVIMLGLAAWYYSLDRRLGSYSRRSRRWSEDTEDDEPETPIYTPPSSPPTSQYYSQGSFTGSSQSGTRRVTPSSRGGTERVRKQL
jgi:hypothetical protein